MAETSIAELIAALNRREDIKAIPNFSGNDTEQYILSWLSEAESIAIIHNWEDTVKRTNFASRFKGPALKWHSQRTTLIQQQKQIDELKKQLDKVLIKKQPPNFQSK